MAFNFKFLRNANAYASRQLAIEALTTQLGKLDAGQPAIAIYTEGEGENIVYKSIFGIASGNSGEGAAAPQAQIFDADAMPADVAAKLGNLDEGKTVADLFAAVNDEIEAITGGGGEPGSDNPTIAGNAAAIEDINDTIGEVEEGKTIVGLIDETKTAITGTLAEGDATTLQAVNAELNGIDDKLATLNGTGEGSVSKALADAKVYTDAEKTRAEGIEAGLQSAIDAEKARAEGIEAGLQSAIDAEKARAEGAEADLQEAIDAEVTRATGAENGIIARLGVIEGEADGSIKKALADAKTYTDTAKAALLGDAAEEYNTLGKLEDKIQAVSGAAKSYEVVALTAEEIAALSDGTNVKEAYKLMQTVGETSAQSGATIKVYKDSSLKSVVLDGQELVFTYITATGAENVVRVDVSTFLAETEFKDGLVVNNESGEVSVKIDESSEGFLTVSANGIKLSGVADAIDADVLVETNRAKGIEEGLQSAIDTLNGDATTAGSVAKAVADSAAALQANIDTKVAQSDYNTKVAALEKADSDNLAAAKAYADEKDAAQKAIINAYTVNGKAISSNPVLAAGDINYQAGTGEAPAVTVAAAIDDLYNEIGTGGSVSEQITAAIEALDAEITSTDGSHVTVKVTEVDGKITAVNVTEDNIAKANELDALEALVGTLPDGGAATVVAYVDEKFAAAQKSVTDLDSEKTGDGTFVDVTVTQVDGLITAVAVAENNIAKADELAAEITRATGAENGIIARLDIIEGEDTVGGSIKKALADAKAYTDAEIAALDATVGEASVAEGKHVAVQVVETDGVITAVNVSESDIASAEGLAAEITRAQGAEADLQSAIDTLNGDATTAGSVAKAVADSAASTKTAYEAYADEAEAQALADAKAYADGLVADFDCGTY